MKQFFTLIGLVLLFNQSSEAQIIQKGSSCLQLGYGFPSAMQMMASVFKFTTNVSDPGSTSSFKYKGFGPLHCRFDYMVGGRVGLGLSANYEKGQFKFTDTYLDENQIQQSDVTTFDYSSINAMARMNIHFIKNASKVDIYYGFGVGYAHTRVNLKETLGNATLDPIEQSDVTDFNNYLNGVFKMFPVAFEEVFGLKVPFGQNAGMYFEVGYSKALCQLGVYANLGGPKGYNSSKWQWF
jgi:hypothetical protein